MVTLAVAALALLPPLQSRLTDQAANDLENATAADAPLFDARIAASLSALKQRQSATTASPRWAWASATAPSRCACAPTRA